MTERSTLFDSNTSQKPLILTRANAISNAARAFVPNGTGAAGAHANVLGVRVEAITMTAALERIECALLMSQKGYICLAGVHGIMEAQRNAAVKSAFDNAFLTLPDGTPTAWVGRLQGLPWMQRLTGPDLMLEIFRNRQFASYRHFLYGGKPDVAQELATNLSRQFPWVEIAGTYTPPFHDLTIAEEQNLVSTIRVLKPHMIWVGISSPRQEMFMHKMLPKLDTSLMFGVGAAFDFHTGRIKDCAEWIKRAGLQWLHRLIQDPRHLLGRYVRNNPAFLWQIALQLAGITVYETEHPSSALTTELQRLQKPNADFCIGDTYG
ncbi:WecB/TagA/CpsF family glycosyltransferase [Telmatobacter sp. DSM 110680]|uniref:WecB/TagA/CpsF family glycosyltransferase n=1 Tax=Telmatobacter sp. DSM 110680 TaxID=3036704 RepID=A0AAU7DPW3_9BACT